MDFLLEGKLKFWGESFHPPSPLDRTLEVYVIIIERAKRAHSLFMSIEISDIYIYICLRSLRFVYPFPPYTQETPLKIVLKFYSILGISGNFNVCGSSRFQC